MIDIKLFEKDPDAAVQSLEKRGEIEGLDDLCALSKSRRSALTTLQAKQEKRNELNGMMKGATPEVIAEKRSEMKSLSQEIKSLQTEADDANERLQSMLLSIPNIPRADVPEGADEDANVEIKRVGTPPEYNFEVRDHTDIGEALGIIDFERAAKISGSRFVFLKGAGCALNRAITHFMIDYHASKGDTELAPPLLVRPEAAVGVGQLPKFEDGMFKTARSIDDPLYLISTAELPVTNYYANEILDATELPKRFFAYSQCFRSEAGAAGRDTRGMIRQHQFEKVEMVRFTTAEQADAELDAMVERASDILSQLGLAHRIVQLCAGDLSFSAEKCFDIEVWLPSQNTYREISSCSTFGTYQARRAGIRYRPVSEGNKKVKPVVATTLNGSGLAIGRTMVAILENYQQADGSIKIPDVLVPYMKGQTVIQAS